MLDPKIPTAQEVRNKMNEVNHGVKHDLYNRMRDDLLQVIQREANKGNHELTYKLTLKNTIQIRNTMDYVKDCFKESGFTVGLTMTDKTEDSLEVFFIVGWA